MHQDFLSFQIIVLILGVSFPVNSVGVIPYEILNISMHQKASALLENAKQIVEQYYAHEEKVFKSVLIFKKFYKTEERK